jgi:hypothetical protein
MPERDAFGREVGEDPLAGLGWTSSNNPPPAPKPRAEPQRQARESQPERRPDPQPRQDRDLQSVSKASAPRRSVSPGSFLVRWIVALAVLGGVGLVVGSMVKSGTSAVRGVVDDVRGAIPTAEVAITESDEPAPDAPGKTLPLTSPRGLRAGLRLMEREVPGRVRTFRLEAARIDVTLWLKGGKLRNAQLQAGAEAPQVFSTTPGGFPKGDTFSYEAVNPGAPAHLIKSANRRLGRRASQVNYLVLTGSGGELTWGVYYKDGAIAQGDRRGRFTRRIS